LRTGARRSERLVEQMLTMARLEPEAAQQAPASVNLERIVATVAAELEPLAEAKGVELHLARLDAAPVMGNEQALFTLAGNLVDNAVRYTPPGGRVTLQTRTEEGAAVLEVKDTGPGIPAAARERVFDRFYRLPPTVTGSVSEGSGLGLAIVKRIAEAHGARIELGEGEQGKGLRVTVRFPIARSK
jgi:two-component system, OmpR family, sensor kinase